MNESNNTNAFKLYIKGNFGKVERVGTEFLCIGQAYHKGKALSAVQFYSLVCSAKCSGTLSILLSNVSGFYSFILHTNGKVIAACDRVRSRPLFYATHESKLYVSDSASWIIAQIPVVNFDKLSEQELAQAGYVTGSNTLVKELKQIVSSSFIQFTSENVTEYKYYQFSPINSANEKDKNELYRSLDRVMKQSIQQLIDYADGRQIVLPLSGGYDSRAIAVYLKESNYKNVVTFTFGKTSSKEVLISKNVANALGFEWHCIKYDRALWKCVMQTIAFNEFLVFISSYVSVPNVQIYPAIKALLESKVIERDAILVPGHTGDFVSGGHIPANLVGIKAKGHEDKIVNAIIRRHYRNKTKLNNSNALKYKILLQINAYMKEHDDQLLAITVFEGWEFAERQAKFIVNSNRYYDFFDLDWWMPLWSESVMGFWESVPLKYRLKSAFWQSFVESKYKEVSGESSTYGNASDQYHPKIMRIRVIFDFFTDENGLYALVPFYRWFLRKLKYPYANGSLFSYLAMKVIQKQKHGIK